jgi:multiple sugar transport system substrate-binding protein
MSYDPYIALDNYSFSDFYEGTQALTKWKGHYIGIPTLIVPVFMAYNKTLFDKAGVKPPTLDWADKTWNWNALLEKAQALTKGTQQYGLAPFPDERYAIRNFGVDYFPQTVQATGYPSAFLGTTPDFIEALQFWGDLINKYKVMPTTSQSNAMQAGLPNLFLTGQFAMTLMSGGDFETFKAIKAFEWGTMPVPWPNKLPRMNFMYPDHYGTIAPQKYPQEAWKLIKALTSPAGELGYPMGALGFLPPRKSMANTWVHYQMKQTGQPEANVRVAINGLKYSTSSPGHVTVEWDSYWEKAFQPSLEQVLSGQTTAAKAVQQMVPLFTQIQQSTNPAK